MKTRLYFPGLNALRFFAALSVIHAHLPDLQFHDAIGLFVLTGTDAVTLFFVLSGFLITYLLLDERARTGDVDVKAFYGRRILRIWPLYFLIIGLVALVLPGMMPLPLDLAAILIFCAHLTRVLGFRSAIQHLWSISIEEWFYAAWPWILKRRALFAAALVLLCARPLIALLLAPDALWHQSPDGLVGLISEMRFECMAIGALGAWLYHRNHTFLLKQFYRLEVSALILMAWIVLFADGNGGILFDDAASVVFMIVIVCVATKPHPALSLESPALRWLGDRTYGIYMFHLPVMYLMLRAYDAAGGPGNTLRDVSVYLAVVGISIGLAALSYRFFEQPFLRLKYRFEPHTVLAPASGD